VRLSALVGALLGVAPEAILGKPCWDNAAWRCSEAAQGTLKEALHSFIQSPLPIECTVVLDKTPLTLRFTVDPPQVMGERHLQEVQSVAKLGSWEFELATGRIVWTPETFRLFGFDPDLGEPDYPTHLNRHHPDDRAALAQAVQAAIQEGIPYDLELRVVLDDGTLRWMHCLGHAVRDSSGQVVRLIGTSQDITERKRREEALQQTHSQLVTLATTDALTGVGNRRALDACLSTEWERANRYQLALSVVLLDVDHFKAYNDTFGHSQGDDVLRRLGGLLIANARKADFIARYGGEEFLVVLPHTTATAALVWAERLRELIAALPWPGHAVTASFGVATWLPQQKDPTLDALLAEADVALYRAKRTRNCVCHHALP